MTVLLSHNNRSLKKKKNSPRSKTRMWDHSRTILPPQLNRPLPRCSEYTNPVSVPHPKFLWMEAMCTGSDLLCDPQASNVAPCRPPHIPGLEVLRPRIHGKHPRMGVTCWKFPSIDLYINRWHSLQYSIYENQIWSDRCAILNILIRSEIKPCNPQYLPPL